MRKSTKDNIIENNIVLSIYSGSINYIIIKHIFIKNMCILIRIILLKYK